SVAAFQPGALGANFRRGVRHRPGGRCDAETRYRRSIRLRRAAGGSAALGLLRDQSNRPFVWAEDDERGRGGGRGGGGASFRRGGALLAGGGVTLAVFSAGEGEPRGGRGAYGWAAPDCEIAEEGPDAWLCFELPRGTYATMLLRGVLGPRGEPAEELEPL